MGKFCLCCSEGYSCIFSLVCFDVETRFFRRFFFDVVFSDFVSFFTFLVFGDDVVDASSTLSRSSSSKSSAEKDRRLQYLFPAFVIMWFFRSVFAGFLFLSLTLDVCFFSPSLCGPCIPRLVFYVCHEFPKIPRRSNT